MIGRLDETGGRFPYEIDGVGFAPLPALRQRRRPAVAGALHPALAAPLLEGPGRRSTPPGCSAPRRCRSCSRSSCSPAGARWCSGSARTPSSSTPTAIPTARWSARSPGSSRAPLACWPAGCRWSSSGPSWPRTIAAPAGCTSPTCRCSASARSPRPRPDRPAYDGPELRMLSVGRLDPEKNPLLLADILAGAVTADPRWRMDICGEGPTARRARGTPARARRRRSRHPARPRARQRGAARAL